MVAADGGFAPAHRTLAEIYGATVFHDAEKQKSETERFLVLCPRSRLTARPDPLPEASPLLEKAEQLLARGGDPNKIIAMTAQAMTDDEWRNQRIRAFDWYTVDFKRRSLSELRDKYWRAWACEVRCYRKAGRVEDAASLLALMEQRAEALRKQPGPAYWNTSVIVARLYVEARRPDRATRIVDRLEQYLTEKPDSDNTRVLETMRKEISMSEGL
jgi:pentatricopeptide repeat protein